jgi:hypothetical protein
MYVNFAVKFFKIKKVCDSTKSWFQIFLLIFVGVNVSVNIFCIMIFSFIEFEFNLAKVLIVGKNNN